MKNKDFLELQKTQIINQMNEAIKNNDTEGFSKCFVELCQKIEDNVLAQAQEAIASGDEKILAQRGVRQLTSEERNYYEKVIDAMKSDDPRQALNDLNVVMPETIIDSVFDDLTTDHPLLNKLSATTVKGLTRMMMNTHGDEMATWGKLTDKIVTELTSGFKEVDATQNKLSAFIPISKAMLDIGAVWLDRYIRTILVEALANGLEYGIVAGTGKEEPIGMIRQVGEGVAVTSGEYPEKNAIKVTKLDVEQCGGVTALIARTEGGRARKVQDLVLIVNPVDYYKKVMPSVMMLTPSGEYRNVLPINAEIIQSAAVPEGKAILGMAKFYFLAVGMGKNGKIEYSDQYHFLEDERVYLIKMYGYGMAKDNNAFQLLDISALKPLLYKVVNVTDDDGAADATLKGIKIGAAALSPTFESETATYTAKTTNTSNAITATPTKATAEIHVKVGDDEVANGGSYTWKTGENTVKITVTDGEEKKEYTVTVTKE